MLGRLRLHGPGRIVIGDHCVFRGNNAVHAAGPGTVRIGAGCDLSGLDIAAIDNVSIGAVVRVRQRLSIDGARTSVGDGCDINAMDIVAAGDVTIGDGVKVYDALHLEGAGHVVLGPHCRINTLHVSADGDVTLGAWLRVRGQTNIDGEGRFIVGDGCTFESGGLGVHTDGPTVTVRIGDECGINGLKVFATDDVTIGDRCMVGSCSMTTTDFHSTRQDRWSRDVPPKRGPITVGNNVWIANSTIVTKNVSIGDNSVVSIGTVVREDVPANVIVASHHQRIVKELPVRD